MPFAVWFGGQQLGIMSLFAMLVVYIFFPFRKIKIDYSSFILISLLFLPIAISLNLNFDHMAKNDSFEFIRILLYLFIFIVAYNTSEFVRFESIVKIAKFFLLFELIFVILQRLEITPLLNILQFIWDNEKNWAYRNTGSFSNPNNLAFFVLLSSLIILTSDMLKKYKLFFWLTAFAIIIFTGSRTGIIAFFILTPLAVVDIGRMSSAKLLKISILFFMILLIFYIIGQYFAEQNKYMFELFQVLATGDLRSVTTFAKRTDHWGNVLLKINDFTYFFGLGPGKEIGLKYIDNDYLATLSKYGIFGIFITTVVYGYIAYKVNTYRLMFLSKLIKLYILLLIVFGLTAETFTSWIFILPFFMLVGIYEQYYKNNFKEKYE